ncbi:phage tail tape measure protein [uncultured Oscillibacter sp.]|uniref:phage tail tape measure protein n=1 Tax=uncultured Oscillibacter sp. TaxID=876091 RepID=UPI002729998B|nr:phage tail tape measure protein [uncultured Oscillibacter sp.]
MENLTARFSVLDEMSAIIERIAQSGQDMADRIERAGAAADSAFGNMSARAAAVARTIDGVATSIDQAEEAQTDLTAAMERASQTMEEVAENDNVSAEAKEELARASEEAEEAMNALTAAQDRAQQAMDEYDQLLASGCDNLDELEEAAQNAADAARELDEANRRAADATDELSDATDRAADEAEEGSERGQKAAEQLATVLTSAGIAKMVFELADAYMEASEAAAEFEVATMKISTIADTTQVSLSTLSGDLLALSMATGQSVNELSEATYSALSASVETASAVEFTATATKLATGGFTSSATAVDVLTTALNAYGLEASYAENISDMLITTQNLGKTTVDELAASVGKVIPLASAYGVEMDNLSTAYAELTKGGIATAEAGTYLKSMLNELGDSGSTVSAVLMEETGSSFSELMDMGYSLGDVMDVLGTSVGGSAGAFNELWSSSEAGIGALSLYNAGAEQFNTTLDAMQTSAGATSAAYATMTDTTAHAQEELSNAAANLQISIGQQINPLIEKLYGLGTNMLNFMTEFTQEHPVVTKAIAAIGIGVGVAAVAMVGVTVATTTAIPAIISFGVALNTALGPIGWVAIGITALTAAVAAFIAMNEENLGETEGMTAATRAQYYELQDLNAEYEKACEQYGETSEEASRLKYQVDDLSAAFEANRQTVEEFTAEVDALCESVHSVSDDFNSALSDINANEVGALSLIQKYDDLASKADRTAAEEKALAAVNKQLAASYPEIAAQMGNATMSTEDYVEAMKKAAEAEAEEQRQQQAQETYIEALQKRAELTDELAKAQENVNLEQQRMDDMSGWDHFWTGGEWDDLEAYQAALEELETAMAENDATIAEIEQGWEDLAEAEAEAAEATVSYEDAVNTALSSVQADIDALCEAYDAAYESARSSIDGQIGLFDTMATETELSITDMQAAFDSQIEYLNTYSENLRKAAEYGLDEGLVASLSDGSEESAGYLNAIIENIEALGDSSAEAQAFVDNFNSSFQEVEAAKDEFATTVATMETDFDEKMAEIEGRLDEAIDNMNMETDAATAAKQTMDAYTQAIRDGTSNAVSAAESAANAVSAALSSSYSGGNVTAVAGHANGTTYAEDAFIAGEEGPELILGKAGSTVFPADETDRIIDAVTNNYDDYSTSYTLATPAAGAGNEDGREEQTKHITLEIAGGSPIEVNGGSGTSKEDIVEILVANLRPALLNIVKDEIFEEGDGSYEH